MAQFSGYFAWPAFHGRQEAVEIEQLLKNSIIETESIAPALCMKMHLEIPTWSMETMNRMDYAFMPCKRLRAIFVSLS
jgi:hypothetical protein